MRVFVALDISDARVIDGLVAFQGELVATNADLKLVERENLHFTIKFLGEITEGQAKDAAERLQALKLAGSVATMKGVGAFPSPGSPRVVWAGVGREDAAKVNRIAGPIINALEGLGQRDDRPFQAHVTLARVRSGRNRQALESLLRANSERQFGLVKLMTFTLKSSLLAPTGPVYSDLGVYQLG